MRPPRLLVLTLAIAIALLAGCGGEKKEGAAELAPARSIAYAQANLDPGGDQAKAVDSLVGKFPGSGPPGDRVQRLLSRAFRQSDSKLSYERDVKPWLGDQVAFFASGLSRGDIRATAALVQTDDEQAAVDAVQRASDEQGRELEYDGKSYRRFDDGSAAGAFDGFLVVGNEDGFKAAVDASKGEALDGQDAFEDALDDAPDDSLATIFVNSPQLARSLPGGRLGPFRRLLADPYTASVTADDEGVEIDSLLPGSLSRALGPLLGEGTDLLAELPGDSWLALGQPDLGRTLSGYLDVVASSVGGRGVIDQQLRASTGLELQRDLLGWMGDFGLFVRGTSKASLGGALVIHSKDPVASARALRRLGALARREASGSGTQVGPLSVPGGGTGFTLRDDELPQPVHVFQRGDRVVLAYGNAAARQALKPSSTLGDSPDYQSAAKSLGSDFAVSTFIAVNPIVALADNLGAASDPDFQRAKPYIEPFGALVGGAKRESDRLDSRLRITLP
jgi:Protein of unknown function (DUF3352)